MFCFWDKCISIGIVKLSLLRTGYLSSPANVLTRSPRFYMSIRLFPTQFPFQWPMNMIKVLWCRFQQCLDPFTILLFKVSSETGFFRHLSGYVFGVCNYENENLWGSSFFPKYLKLNLDFKNAAKIKRKVFLWDNCFSIGVNKLSLWRTGYLSSAANVLITSPKILHVHKRDFLELNWLRSDQWTW